MKYFKFTHQLLIALSLVVVFVPQCSTDEAEEPTVKIASISPASGAIGTVVVISGKGFDTKKENNIVKFNGVQGEVSYSTNETLIATVLSGTTTGKVTVQVANETATGPIFTVTDQKTYYIKFKINGVQKMYDQNYPDYIITCGHCACGTVPGGDINSAQMEICNDNNDMVTAADIESWQGEKMSFSDDHFPSAKFNFYHNDTSYFAYFADDQQGSEVNITNVVKVPTGLTASSYRVTGDFKCSVASATGKHKNITDGEFVVLFTEH